MNCANCNERLLTRYRYCPSCSQKAHLERLSLQEVGHEAIHYFTHADKSIFSLVRNLATRGGLVAREYILGMRKKHFSPLNFFLLVAAGYLLAMNLEQAPPTQILRERPALSALENDPRRDDLERFYHRQEVAVKFMQERSNLIAIVTIPLTALIFFGFYQRNRFNYTEHLVANLYMVGFATLIYTIVIVANTVFRISAGWLAFGQIAFQTLYYAWFYFRFMENEGRARAAVSALCATLVPGAIGTILILVYTFELVPF